MHSISLETNWRYFPTEVMDAAYGVSELDESSWGLLPNLADYPRDLIAVSGTLNLRHTFDVEPIGDVCLRFYLDLQHAPIGTQVYVNGWYVGTMQAGETLHADVTDTISLEDNLLLIKLTHPGDLSGLSLQLIPCDI
jgi:hypothetical protein